MIWMYDYTYLPRLPAFAFVTLDTGPPPHPAPPPRVRAAPFCTVTRRGTDGVRRPVRAFYRYQDAQAPPVEDLTG